MNAKHYVSLTAAKKLKELGYVNNNGFFFHATERSYRMLHGNPLKPEELVTNMYYAPTLLEAMDWLEERGIVVNVYLLASFRQKGFTYCIAFADVKDNIYSNDNNEFFPDKYSAYHAAIEKALELL